jgi:Tol biopolymer transport system component
MLLLTLLLALATVAIPARAAQVPIPVEGHAYNPHWAPNGQWIAFELNQYGDNVDLYIVKVTDGIAQIPRKVMIPGVTSSFSARGSVVASPVWHPEGTLLFEGSNAGGTQRLYYFQPGGQTAAELLTVSQIAGDLTWPSISPDGRNVAFVSDVTGAGDIYLWSQATNQVRTTFSDTFADAAPRFASDNTTLAFSRKNRGTEDLYLWTGGTDVTLLRGGNGDQSRPIWVADRILYFTNERGEGHWDIAVTDRAGSERTILARDVRLPMRAPPAITPDGRSVVYTWSDPQKADRLVVTTLDGATTVELPTGLVACGEPDLVLLDGRVWAAFTALPDGGSDWRQLHVLDVTGKLP